MEFKSKEVIQGDSREHLNNYYNWMSITIGTYNKLTIQGDTLRVSDLSEPYKHIHGDKNCLRASFTLTFEFEDCVFEHPKWYRYWFYEGLYGQHSDFTDPPGYMVDLGDMEVHMPYVQHIKSLI